MARRLLLQHQLDITTDGVLDISSCLLRRRFRELRGLRRLWNLLDFFFLFLTVELGHIANLLKVFIVAVLGEL